MVLGDVYHYIVCFSIMKEHAILSLGDNYEYELKPAAPGAKTKVNGQPLTGSRILNHKDRILFGYVGVIWFTQYYRPNYLLYEPKSTKYVN